MELSLLMKIDLHLHPTWQAGLVEALKTIFPRVQFILTTHSPSILQILEKDEIIALGTMIIMIFMLRI